MNKETDGVAKAFIEYCINNSEDRTMTTLKGECWDLNIDEEKMVKNINAVLQRKEISEKIKNHPMDQGDIAQSDMNIVD